MTYQTRSPNVEPGGRQWKNLLRFLAPGILVLALGRAAAVHAGSLENVRTDSWVYDAVDHLKTAGYVTSVPSTSRPWTREYAARLVAEAIDRSRSKPATGFASYYLERLEGELVDELVPTAAPAHYRKPAPVFRVPADSAKTLDIDFFSRWKADTDNQSGSAGIVIDGGTPDKFAAYTRFEFIGFRETLANQLDSAWYRHVPGTREDRYRHNFLVDLTEGYIRFKIPWLELEVGRDYNYWGPGYLSSVLLSNTAPSLDKIQLTADYRRFKFTSFTAALSTWRARMRFLSAQRLEVNFWNHVVAGASLLVVHAIEPDTSRNTDATQTKDFWAYLLDPLIPIYPEMANANHTDNLLVGADVAAYLPRVKVYGQFLVDNMQLDSIGPWEDEPPLAIGAQGGLLATIAPAVNFRYEYARVSNFTYYHWVPQISYANYQVPLGHSLGPDADQHYAEVTWCPLSWGQIGLTGSVTRRGERNYGDWTNRTWFPGVTYQSRKFPFGAVNDEISVGPKVTIEPFSWLHLTAQGDWYTRQQYDSLGKTSGSPTKGISFNAKLELRY